MKPLELFALLALVNAPSIGNLMAKKLLSFCEAPSDIFKENQRQLAKIPGFNPGVYKALKDPKNFRLAEKELKFIEQNCLETLYFKDATYPANLAHCIDAPILLFQKGKVNFNNQKILSIVGTRKMTSYGASVLENLFKDLQAFNPIIVSGLAYGVDIYAHEMAIKHKLQTLGILAHGLDMLYPALHKKFAAKMVKNGGLLTEFCSGIPPEKQNFVRRNRIVAGISKATLVVESAAVGGSLITASMANSYNRDVFAIPGRISDPFSIGCNQLIKTNRAAVLTSAKDLAYILNWQKDDHASKAVQKQLFISLEPLEKRIFDYLNNEGKQQLDLIALHCNLPIYQTASVLLKLELKGLAKPLPGKYFKSV